MKITKTELKKLIKESLNEVMKESRKLKEDVNMESDKPLYMIFHDTALHDSDYDYDDLNSCYPQKQTCKIVLKSNSITDVFKYIDDFFIKHPKPLDYNYDYYAGCDGWYDMEGSFYKLDSIEDWYLDENGDISYDNEDLYIYVLVGGLISIQDGTHYVCYSLDEDTDAKGIDGFNIDSFKICCLNKEDTDKIGNYIKSKYSKYDLSRTYFGEDHEREANILADIALFHETSD